MKYEEKKQFGEQIYKGKVVTLSRDTVTLSNGKDTVREIVKHPGGACVVALTDNDELLLVNQFRYGAGTELLELPAGKIDDGENPFFTARRELAEEVGGTAEDWTYLGKIYPTPAYNNEITHLFLATGVQYDEKKQHLDDNELLDIKRMQFGKAVRMAVDGGFQDAKTVVGILRVYSYVHNGYKITEEEIIPEDAFAEIETAEVSKKTAETAE
ncbi:MAG: NUDIX hydrolase [Oscillospiraceae bacterium]|jgi:ADP-ribose pyrophosphatase|nr:NUDIX hydrolase [Oscillospiraceae bacterium]